jgi:predicted PurR-regulated permease PerM
MFEGLDLGPKQRATVAAATALGAALVLAVFGAVQAIEGYVLTPRIMGSRTGLNPALIIFALFSVFFVAPCESIK